MLTPGSTRELQTHLDGYVADLALAASHGRRGDAHLAVPILERVVAELAAEGEGKPLHRLALNNLGVARVDAGDAGRAREALNAALTFAAVAEGDPEEIALERARLLDNLGAIAAAEQAFARAEVHAAASFRLFLELRGPGDLDTLVAEQNLATARMRLGRFDEAARTLDRVGPALAALVGEAHPLLVASWLSRAELAVRRGDLDEAEPALTRTLALAAAAGLNERHYLVTAAHDLRATLAG